MKRIGMLMLLMLGLSGTAQTHIKLISGAVTLDNVALPAKVYIPLDNIKSVRMEKGAKALVFNRDKSAEIKNPVAKTWKIPELEARLAKEPKMAATSNARDFAACVARNNQMMRVEQRSGGATLAATDGLNPDGAIKKEVANEEYFFPVDSALVLGESVQLKWNSTKNFIKPKILLIHQNSKDTTELADVKIPGSVTVTVAKPGNYKWVLISTAGKRIKETRYFRKASGSEQQQARKDLASFEKYISRFSPETRQELLSDYKSKMVE